MFNDLDCPRVANWERLHSDERASMRPSIEQLFAKFKATTASRLLKKFVVDLLDICERDIGSIRGDRRYKRVFGFALICSPPGRLVSLRPESSGCERDVCGRRQYGEPLDQIATSMTGFAQATKGLHPAERLSSCA